MTTMVEKVARALTEVQIRSANELFKLTNPRRLRSEERIIAAIDSGWRLNEKDARAAIEALMEPTKEMVSAGYEKINENIDFWNYESGGGYSVDDIAPSETWRAMIEEALKEQL